MKYRRKKAAIRPRAFRVWTHSQAISALPFIASVMRSIREHHLRAIRHRLRVRRLRQRPGRPDRTALLALEEVTRELARAEEQLREALRELWRLNVYCLDAAAGIALIPFAHPEQQLAWFVFELFGENQLQSWRFQSDPLEERRPITDEVTAPTLIV